MLWSTGRLSSSRRMARRFPRNVANGECRATAEVRRARIRVYVIVSVSAAVIAAMTVGVTVLQTRGESSGNKSPLSARPLAGYPPLELNFGLRTDAESRALLRAAAIYDVGRRRQAATTFARYRSQAALLGRAYVAWKTDGLLRVERLAKTYPNSPMILLHLGLAFLWAGRTGDGHTVLRETEAHYPDSPYALTAASLLHPNMPPLPLPEFTPETPEPTYLVGVSSRQQISLLQTHSRAGDPVAALYYGIRLQELGHRVSAERQFRRAAALEPATPEFLTAAAVGLFSKGDPSPAFARLGPLVARFPHAAVVRFYLGYLLIWIGEERSAARQLRLAVEDAPKGAYVASARTLLKSFKRTGR